MSGHKLNPADALRYISAGRGQATLVGRQHRFSYAFSVSTKRNVKPVVFVSVLGEQRAYIGFIKDAVLRAGTTGQPQHPAFGALAWFLDKAQWAPHVAELAEFWHAGTCGLCGRTLTTPESIARGFGPECWKNL